MDYRGWSYSETARRANVSQSMISKVMAYKASPGLDFCRGIAKALNLSPDAVFIKAGLIGNKPGDTENPTLREIWGYLKTMDHEQLRAVREFVRFQSATGGRRGIFSNATNAAEGTNNYDATPPPPTLSPDPKTST